MRVLTAELYNPENEMSTRIILPASYEEMQDALQRIKGNAHDCVADIQNFLDGIEPLGNKTLQSCRLYELNHFAALYQNIKGLERENFEGMVEVFCTKKIPQVNDVINIALNTPGFNGMVAPASNDHDLGEFYVENELLDGLADLEALSDEAYQWVCDNLDLAKIGREIREHEKGAYISGGYFVANEEIKELYDGVPVIPKQKDYVFRLELARLPEGDEPNDVHTVSLSLPATDTEIARALTEVGVSEMSDCVFYGFESVAVPQLSDIYGDNDDFADLNHLADQISGLDESSLITYKAMLDTAITVFEHIDEFTLDRQCDIPSDYADKVLKGIDLPMKKEFEVYLSKNGYGKALMQHHGVDETDYGLLIPSNGIKLSEQLETQRQNHSMMMTMQ